jgi:hypothetical protein
MDFAGTLRCIPMAVRFKLDQCGVKLSLRQWSRFTVDDRRGLLETPCASADEVAAYRAWLIELIAVRAEETAKDLPADPEPAWASVREVPSIVSGYASSLGLAPPRPSQWAGLSPLQRFALLKLTREGHDNANFLPAMREFGLAPGDG